MKTKDVLLQIVDELEKTGALVSALQGKLISKNHISEQEVAAEFPKLQKVYQDHLAGLRSAIAQLPE